MRYFLDRYYPGHEQIEDSDYCINIEDKIFNMKTYEVTLKYAKEQLGKANIAKLETE